MTKEELQKLYKEKVLPENKDPYHFKVHHDAQHHVDAYNPLCGDKFKLYLEENDDNIGEAFFDGIGCAISKASTSILLRKIEGKSKKDIENLCRAFLNATDKDNDIEALEDEDLKVLAALKHFDGRMDCVKLSWAALKKYLQNKD